MPRFSGRIVTPDDFSNRQRIRFWMLVRQNNDDGCWEWMGGRYPNGYGRFHQNHATAIGAHRLAYVLSYGKPLTAPDCVLHRCDNPTCVRPNHLFLGTAQDNVADMMAKRRHARQRGYVLPPDRYARGMRNGKYTKPEATARGTRQGLARLSDESVITIRQDYATGTVTLQQLANKYRVNVSTVHRAIRRKTWTHI